LTRSASIGPGAIRRRARRAPARRLPRAQLCGSLPLQAAIGGKDSVTRERRGVFSVTICWEIRSDLIYPPLVPCSASSSRGRGYSPSAASPSPPRCSASQHSPSTTSRF
jgi:hypothetical protein